MRQWSWLMLIALLVVGCSKTQQEQANQALDYGTGKTQVETYQRTRDQLHVIRDGETQQLDDTLKH